MSNFKIISDSDLRSVKITQLAFRAINHKLRQQIVAIIDEKGESIVTDLYVKLRIEQSVASQHLAILRKAGLVKVRRDGKFILYSINKPMFDEVVRISNSYINSLSTIKINPYNR